MNVQGEKEKFAELWRALPSDAEAQIHMAIRHGDKMGAINLRRILGKGFDLDLAKQVVENSAVDLVRRRLPGK